MMFKPRKVFSMWDNWLWYQDGTYYAYYLTMGATKRQGWHGQGVALATSKDGVHWDEHGVVIPKDPGATGLGSGAVWKAADFEKTGRFIMNYSTWFDWCIESQNIRFAESTDLVHWRKLGPRREFKADPRWYATWPKHKNARWDCIYPVARPGGGLYGYWTAVPKKSPGFGFGETLDGVHWRALPPPAISETGQGEVGAIERIGDRYYMMYHGGGLMLVSDSPKGPFVAVEKNREFFRGHAYFTRFFPTPEALLVNHQSWPRGDCVGEGSVRLAPLKKAVQDGEGTVRLAWWEGNEKLKGRPVAVAPGLRREGRTPFVQYLKTGFDAGQGLVLEGTLPLASAFPRKWPAQFGVEHFPAGAPMSGLYLECEPQRGSCILCSPNGVTEVGLTDADGSFIKRELRFDRALSLGRTAPFRLLLKGSMLEFYVADILMLVYSLPQPSTGRIGLIGRAGAAGARGWRAWEFSI